MSSNAEKQIASYPVSFLGPTKNTSTPEINENGMLNAVKQLATAVGNMQLVKKEDVDLAHQYEAVSNNLLTLINEMARLFKEIHSTQPSEAPADQQAEKSNVPKFRI